MQIPGAALELLPQSKSVEHWFASSPLQVKFVQVVYCNNSIRKLTFNYLKFLD